MIHKGTYEERTRKTIIKTQSNLTDEARRNPRDVFKQFLLVSFVPSALPSINQGASDDRNFLTFLSREVAVGER